MNIEIPPERLLATLRTMRGLSQREVAEKAGTSAAYLSQVERGIRNPSPSLRNRILSALGEVRGISECPVSEP